MATGLERATWLWVVKMIPESSVISKMSFPWAEATVSWESTTVASQPTPLLVCHAGSLYFLLCTFSYIYSMLLGLFIWLENPNKGLCVRLKVRSVLEVWIDAFDLSLTPLLGCRLHHFVCLSVSV